MMAVESFGKPPWWWRNWPWLAVIGSALLGLGLIVDQAFQNSATYDEVAYLKVGTRWWRTGEQSTITRMGSPLSSWKIEQAPTLWVIDHFGDRSWIDDPITHQAKLLPWVRVGGSWIWLVGLGIAAAWARGLYGAQAMALAAALFALSPNLLAHGALATMELPLVASSAALLMSFDYFLRTDRRVGFWAAAVLAGLAFSCKFTTILLPPILALIWAIDLWRQCDRAWSGLVQSVRTVGTVGWGMIQFGAVMVLTNLVLTGFALSPLSPRSGSHPFLDRHLPPALALGVSSLLERSYPADWVGFSTQIIYQKQGGPSYLLGERRTSGWWYYYLVALAVKVPPAFWWLVVARCWIRPERAAHADRRGWVIPVFVGLFLLAAVVGSKRNYGVRYLLPAAVPAIVFVAGMAGPGRKSRWACGLGLVGMAVAVATVHPYELTYFNLGAGGVRGGRRILADSNLDWGQGAVAVARLQVDDPAYRDLTWYYFGDTDPGFYGVAGRVYQFDAHHSPPDLPPRLTAMTRFLAVSASLQWGPWGPDGYFRGLNRLTPVRYSADSTVAIYRTADLVGAGVPLKTGRAPE